MMRTSLAVLAVTFASGCFTRPMLTSGATDQSGIRVTLVGQQCLDTDDDGEPFDTSELSAKLLVENDTTESIVFLPGAVTLYAAGMCNPPLRAPAPVEVPPGDATQLIIDFAHQSRCTAADFSLGLAQAAAFTSGARVALGPIWFRPY